jgi:dTDP-4-amino-4,6-dideoxygalactose transaminase
MIKRVKPYYRKEWVDKLQGFLENWDYWKEGALMELERRVADHVGRKFAIAANSTTNSIFMALYVWKQIHPTHDDVIMPNWGYPAAYKACKVLGLNPVPVEIDKFSLTMNQQSVYDYMGNTTLACVHIGNNGIIGDPESVKEVLYDDILFIEDSAPALLQDTAGIHGDVSMFSFSPTKPFCAGEGSIILTDNESLADALREFRYIGEYTNLTTSLNFAMSALLATYLLPQFDIMDEISQMRDWVHAEYRKHLDIFVEPYIKTNRHGAIMYLSPKAEQISKKLKVMGIEHRYQYYPNFENDPINFPVACQVKKEIIDLPMHQDLTSEQIRFICNVIRKVEDA